MYVHNQSRSEVLILVLWIFLDMADRRTVRAQLPSVPPHVPSHVLHDVMSTLHGYDRHSAGHVCTAWQRATLDPLLPISTTDVASWIRPRADGLKALRVSLATTRTVVNAVWALIRYWLEGGK
jgi:hypothetical protein